MKAIYAILFLFFLCLPVMYAQEYYLQAGFDFHNENRHAATVDVTSTPVTVFQNFQPSNKHIAFDSYPPLIGDVDGDNVTDVVLYAGNFDVYIWDGASSLLLRYDDLQPNGTAQLSATRGSTAVLHDGDGDGDHELFFCGFEGAVTYIGGYDWNGTTPYEMWRVPIGTSDGSGFQCDFFPDAGFGTRNSTYLPKAARVNNTEYVYFVARANQSVMQNTGGTPNVWKINAMNGSAQNFSLIDTGACTGTSIDPMSPAGFGSPVGGNIIDIYGGASYKGQPTVNPTICESGDNSEPLLYIPVDCAVGGGVGNRGLYTLRADALTDPQYRNMFGDLNTPMSSPGCFESQGTTKDRAVIIGAEDGTNGVRFFFSEGSTISEFNTDTLPVDVDVLSDVFRGEFSSSSSLQYDDICFFVHDTAANQLGVFCTDVDAFGLLSNPDDVVAVENVAGAHGPDWDLWPYVHTTSGSFSSPATVSDVFFNGGLYKAAPDGAFARDLDMQRIITFPPTAEGLNYVADGYGFGNGSCSMGDITNDGLIDSICSGNILLVGVPDALVLGNQEPTYTVTEKSPVNGRCLSGGSCTVTNNQTVTYNLSAVDADGDPMKYAYDCDDRFSPAPTALQTIENSVNITCTYTSTGTFTTRFWVTDDTTYENQKNIAVTSTYPDGTLCNNNGVFEPFLGETVENCLSDAVAQSSAEAEAEAANNAAQRANRQTVLEQSGVNLSQSLSELSVDDDGEIQTGGLLSDLEQSLTRILQLILVNWVPLLILILLLAIITILLARIR